MNDSFQILSLSGGGYKGLYTALILSEFEKKYDTQIYKHFDLIAGTSIGGIIALGLSIGIPAEKIVHLLVSKGPAIFNPLETYGVHRFLENFANKKTKNEFGWKRGIRNAKHSPCELERVLKGIFSDQVMNDLKTRVLIPTANFSSGKAQFFKTRHNQRYVNDGGLKLLDIALATSAAPLYFPAHKFNSQIYVDGGLVGNNPAIFALDEVERNVKDIEFDNNKIKLLSIGALAGKVSIDPLSNLDMGAIAWASELMKLTMACQEKMVEDVLKFRLGGNSWHIDSAVHESQSNFVSLDRANEKATAIIQSLAQSSIRENVSIDFVTELFKHKAQSIAPFDN